MSTHFESDQVTHGDVVVERFAGMPATAALTKPLAAFKTVHAALAKASSAAATARGARDAALAAIGEADDALDAAVLSLADKLVGAGLGTRKNAFASYSAHAPGAVTELPYATEVKEVGSLCARIRKAKPPSDVVKAVAGCEKLAAAVTKALASLSKPQLAYARALASRDGQLPAWTKALTTLKRKALAELDDLAQVRALFAPPARVQYPKKKRGPATNATANGATGPNTPAAQALSPKPS